MIAIRHESRGPYAERTIIEWPGLTTESYAEEIGRTLERVIDTPRDAALDALTDAASHAEEVAGLRDTIGDLKAQIARLHEEHRARYDRIQGLERLLWRVLKPGPGGVKAVRDDIAKAIAPYWRRAA
jgi:ribosomal protein L17